MTVNRCLEIPILTSLTELQIGGSNHFLKKALEMFGTPLSIA